MSLGHPAQWLPLLALTSLACPWPGTGGAAIAQSLSVVEVNSFRFEAPSTGDLHERAEGLSGVSYIGGDQFLAVSDLHAQILRLTISVDRSSGAVVAAEFEGSMELTDTLGASFPEPAQGPDREALAVDNHADVVWIANERVGEDPSRPSIAAHDLHSGRMIELVALGCDAEPPLFCGTRENQSLEALAYDSTHEQFWTANEQALLVDGGPPDRDQGASVRLQQFDRGFRPGPQFLYRTAKLSATTPAEVIDWGISGIVELLALPNGNLLALERATVGDARGRAAVRVQLYEVNVSGATDLSRSPWTEGLLTTGEAPVPVRKRLLIELIGETGPRSNFNFEGMALGPRLANGDRSLILVADNGTGVAQHIYALRVVGLPN